MAETDTYKTWLDSLKPGDLVATSRRFGGYDFDRVQRFTKTQIITSHNRRYSRANGYAVGHRILRLEIPTNEIVEECEKRRLAFMILNTSHDRLCAIPQKELCAFVDLLEGAKKE